MSRTRRTASAVRFLRIFSCREKVVFSSVPDFIWYPSTRAARCSLSAVGTALFRVIHGRIGQSCCGQLLLPKTPYKHGIGCFQGVRACDGLMKWKQSTLAAFDDCFSRLESGGSAALMRQQYLKGTFH